MLQQRPCEFNDLLSCGKKHTDKSRVQKNVSESILLKTPTEVRDSILRYVLGDRLIHIKYLTKDEYEEFHIQKEDEETKPASDGLCSAFCIAEQSEQEAYDKVNLSSEYVSVTEDLDHIETCKDRHTNCLMFDGTRKEMMVSKLQAGRLTFATNLSILAACRLLYEESNNVLWQTNTFSFDNPNSFTKFCSSMNPSQKHKLKKVHISMPMIIDSGYYRKELCAAWARAITPRVLTPLKNLNTIHLCFDQCCDYTDPVYARYAISNEESRVQVKDITNTMLGLRALPWMDKHDANRGKHVTVIIGDDDSTKVEISTPRWTKAQKLETAETLRAQLAATDSVETQAVAKAVEKATKEAERQKVHEYHKKLRTDDVGKAQALVDEARAELEQCQLDRDTSESVYDKAIKEREKGKILKELSRTYWFRYKEVEEAKKELIKQTKTLRSVKARLVKWLASSIADGGKSSGTKKDPKTK